MTGEPTISDKHHQKPSPTVALTEEKVPDQGSEVTLYRIRRALPLAIIALANAGLVLGTWALSPMIDISSPVLAYVLTFLAVMGMTLSSAAVAPVVSKKWLFAVIVLAAATLAGVFLAGDRVVPPAAAVVVTVTLLFAGAVIGGSVGGRIEHPGHLLMVVVVSILVDTLSVFHSSGPTAAVVARPAVVSVLALPWPLFGSNTFVPVLGVGDVIFASLYMAASRKFELQRVKTASALAIGLILTMVGVMFSGLPLPALIGMGLAVLIAHGPARRLPVKDRRKALMLLIGISVLWALLWLRHE